MASDELKTRRWRDLCERLKREMPPICHYCGGDIDLSISGREKWGWTADHLTPRHEAPHLTFDPSNIAPAHNWCNSTRGGSVAKNVNTSQKWG